MHAPRSPLLSLTVVALGVVLGGDRLAAQSGVAEGRRIVVEAGCGVCHAGLPVDPGVRSAAPERGGVPEAEARSILSGSHRPTYRLSEAEAEALAAWWAREPGSVASPSTGGVPDAGAAGRALYAVYGCGGCHGEAPGVGRFGETLPLAPALTEAGSTLRRDWMRAFLAEPVPVRPAGFHPGTRARMPDFDLSPDEADAVAAYLETLRGGGRTPAIPEPLTPWGTQRAERYLTDRLSCLGCHQWRGRGGLLGPPLDGLRDRLTPEGVVRAIREPASRGAHTVMPRSPFRGEILEEVTALLVHDTVGWHPVPEEPDVPWDQQIQLIAALVAPAGDPAESDGYYHYQRRCAQCHGTRGDGGGYNARYLPVAPTAHVNGAYMGTRPDDTLYDGIAAGGWVLDRSHRMPAFGRSLDPGTVRQLVRYLRELCDCQGPSWSSVGAGGAP